MKIEISKLLTRPDYLLACGFGSGLVPRAPGTAGSALGLLLFIPFLSLSAFVQAGVITVGLLVGIYLSGRVASELELKDPGMIVWDEFVGMWITMFLLPSLYWLPVAFVLFRLLDITKPWPVSWADRQLEGGLGIMLDDVIAGIMALICLQALNYAWLMVLTSKL